MQSQSLIQPLIITAVRCPILYPNLLSLSVLLLGCAGEETGPSATSAAGTSTSGGSSAGGSAGSGGDSAGGSAGAASGGSPSAGQSGAAGSAGAAGSSAGASAGGSGGIAGSAGSAGSAGAGGQAQGNLAWPDQRVAAVSLTYDDGLDGQLRYAVPALDAAGLTGTFFLASFQGVPHVWSLPNTTDALNERHMAWQAVLASGHELAGHTVYHPCDDNNPGYQPADYDLESMGAELDDSIARLTRLGAAAPFTFAFPCSGDTRGVGPEGASVSYAPEVAERFLAARVSMGGVNDPAAVDLQLVNQFGTTDATGAELIADVDAAIAAGGWTVFTFHGVGPEDTSCDINTFDLQACALNYLTTPEPAHQELIDYLVSKQAELWVAPFKDVALHIQTSQGGGVPSGSGCEADAGLDTQCTDPAFPHWYRCQIPYTEPPSCMIASIGNATDWYCCP